MHSLSCEDSATKQYFSADLFPKYRLGKMTWYVKCSFDDDILFAVATVRISDFGRRHVTMRAWRDLSHGLLHGLSESRSFEARLPTYHHMSRMVPRYTADNVHQDHQFRAGGSVSHSRTQRVTKRMGPSAKQNAICPSSNRHKSCVWGMDRVSLVLSTSPRDISNKAI